MNQDSATPLLVGQNLVWLTFPNQTPSVILQGQLLGLGSDHSLLCGVPSSIQIHHIHPGLGCKGHTLIEGETYQFEATVRAVQLSPPGILLNRPYKIMRRPPRQYPRVPVSLSGFIRPMADNHRVLAVLPATLIDLCPTGCQLHVEESIWPKLATMDVVITCKVPGISHTSKLPGTIEWIDPSLVLQMGIQFRFSSPDDVACQDLTRWFHSQKAKFIDTVI